MNAGPDVERLISNWLVEEAPERAPDRILGAAAQTIDRTKQRRLGAAWREPMTLSMSRLVAAAVIVVAAVVGAGWIGRSTAIVGDGPTTAPATTAPPPSGSPSVNPAASSAGSVSGAIPEGTYASAPVQVADIIALANADTALSPDQRTHIVDVLFGIRDHTTFAASIELKDGKWTQRQSVDGAEQVGQEATYTFLDANTVVLRDEAGVGGFEVTRLPNGFTLKSLTPQADAEEAFAVRILFESGAFIRVP